MMDEFEKWLESMRASKDGGYGYYNKVMSAYRAFKAKQEAKPPAPASLVEDLKAIYKLYRNGKKESSKIVTIIIGELLYRHEARKEMVLAEGEVHTECAEYDMYVGVENINDKLFDILGKKGRLIFLEDKEEK